MLGYFLNKVAALKVCNFFKNRPQHVFPENIAKFLRIEYSYTIPLVTASDSKVTWGACSLILCSLTFSFD